MKAPLAIALSRLAVGAFALCWTALMFDSSAQADSAAEEWIVAVHFGKRPLTENLLILMHDDQPYLPVSDFAALLLIPVTRDEDGTLTGEISSSGRAFAIDGALKFTETDGTRRELMEDAFFESDEGMFLSSDELERLLGIELAFDQRNLSFEVSSEDSLPLEVQEQQKRLRERFLREKEEPVQPLRQDVPYAMIAPPMGDVDLFVQRNPEGELSLNYDTLVSMEAGALTTFLFASGNDLEPLRDARIKAGRQSFDGGVFGLESVTEAWGGDVQQPSLPLVGGGGLGRGFLVSSLPLDRPDSFDATTIDGDAQPGWEVELYQNGLLVDFQTVSQDGRYNFDTVELGYGANIFRLVFYGPNGEIREETRRVTVGGEMARPGETLFRGYVGQPGQRTLAPLLDQGQSYDESGFSFEVTQGLGRHLSATAFAGRTPTSREAFSDFALFGGAGARLSWENLAVDGNLALQEGGGIAFDLGGIVSFDGISLSGRHARYNGFESPAEGDSGEPLESVTTLRVNTAFPAATLGPINLTLRGEHRSYADNRDRYTAGADLRHSVGPVYLDHAFDLRHETYGEDMPATTSALYNPAFSFRLGEVWARGGARLDLTGPDPLESLSASARYRLTDVSTIGGQASYAPLTDSTQFGANYSHEFSFTTLSAFVNGNDRGEVTAGLGLSFSFGFDREYRPFITGERMAERGAITPFVYHDRDADGRFDAGRDTPLADVGFTVASGVRVEQKTNEEGYSTLTNLTTTDSLVMEVDRSTLDDPFWVSAKGPIELRPRPARILPVEIPIVEGGEISGSVMREIDGRDQQVGGLELLLIDRHGRRIASTRSQVDGYFLFETVPPGHYVVRVKADQELDDVPIDSDDIEIVVPAGGALVEGLEIAVNLLEAPLPQMAGEQR